MHWLFKRQRFGVRLIALAVTISFLYADVVQAQGFSSSIKTIPVSDPTVSLDPMAGFELPPEVGQLKQAYLSNRHEEEKFPYVVHIQDSHANYSAQQNIDKILNRLFENGFNGYTDDVLICLEGAAGEMDPSLFRALRDAKAKRAVSDAYLKEGKINAAEFFALNQAKEIPLYGIEDAALYLENVQAHHDVVQVRSEVAPRLQKQIEENQLAKERSLPKVFLAFDEKTRQLYQDQIGLSGYLNWLSSEIEVDGARYPNLKEMAQALELQKSISGKGVAREREVLIEKLKQRLVKEDLAGLIKLSLEYRLGKIESLEFHSSLLTLAQIYKLNGIYPQLEKLILFLEMQKKLNTEQAMVELTQLFDAVKAQFLVTDEQKKLQQESEWLTLAKGMIELEVTRDQLRAYFQEKEGILQFVDTRSLRAGLEAAERFYAAAQKRDAALVQNTFQALKLHNKQIAILITGGFHTDGLLAQLRGADTSHMVIAPRMTEGTDTDLYQSLMEPILSPLQRYLLNAGNRLAAPSYLFSPVILGNDPELRGQIRETDTFRFILEYLGYRAYQMQEFGENARTIEMELQAEMTELASQMKGKLSPEVSEYWEAYFKQIAATRFPRGLLLSSTAKLPDESVALLVVKGKQAFKHAIETQTIDGKQFIYGGRDLEEEALVQRSLALLKKRAKARERLARKSPFELKQIEKIDVASALGNIKAFMPQARKVLFGGVQPEDFDKAKELLKQINLDVLALGMYDKDAADVARKIQSFRVGKEAMELPHDAETLIFEAIEAYEKAADYLQLRDTEQFLVSYEAAEKRNQLNDLQTLKNLLDVIDVAELTTTLAHYPWFAIQDESLSVASLSSNYAAMQQLVQQIAKGKEPQEEIKKVRKFLRSVWFAAQMDQIKNRDVAEAETKAHQRIEERQRQKLGEPTDLFLAKYLLSSIDLLPQFRGEIAMLSTDTFNLLQAHIDNRSKPQEMEKDLSKFLGLPEDIQLEQASPIFIEQFKELKQASSVFIEQLKELEQITPVFTEQVKELQQTPPAFIEQFKKLQQTFPTLIDQFKAWEQTSLTFIEEYKKLEQAPPVFIKQFKRLQQELRTFVWRFNELEQTLLTFVREFNELKQSLPAFIEQFKESQQVPPVFIEKLKKMEQMSPVFIKRFKELQQTPPIFMEQFKNLEQAFSPDFIERLKKMKQALPEFIAQFKETYKKINKEMRVELTESEAAMEHPFWAQELPYIPKEAVFQIKTKLSKKEKKQAGKNHFFVSDNVFYVDLHSLDAKGMEVLEEEVKNQARNYLRSTRAAVQAEQQTLSDLVRRYEVAVGAKNRAERKKIFIELKRFFADPKHQQAKEFYRSVLTKELTEKVKEKFWGFWNEVREMCFGIYQFAEGGKWNLFFGRLTTAVPALFVLVILFSFFAGALHAQEDQEEQKGQGQPKPKEKKDPKEVKKGEGKIVPDMSPQTQETVAKLKQAQQEFLKQNAKSLNDLIDTQRKMISLHQEAMQASNRLVQVKGSLTNDYFSALVDLSQSEVTLDKNTELPAPTQTHGTTVTFYDKGKYQPLIFETYADFDEWLYDHANIVQYLDHDKKVIQDILQIKEMEKMKAHLMVKVLPQTYQSTAYRFQNGKYEHLIFGSNTDFETWYQEAKNLKGYDLQGEILKDSKEQLWQRIKNGESFTLVSGDSATAQAGEFQWWGKRNLDLSFEFGRKAKEEQAELAELDYEIAKRKLALDAFLSNKAHRFVRFNPKDKKNLFEFEKVDSIFLANGKVIENSFQETSDLLDKIPPDLFIYREYPENENPFRFEKGKEITSRHQLGEMTKQNKPFEIWVYDANLGEELLLASGKYAVESKLFDSQAYMGERIFGGLIRELVSRGIPEGTNLEALKKQVADEAKDLLDAKGKIDPFPGFPKQLQQGHRYFAFAEATMKEGWITGVDSLHEQSDLDFELKGLEGPADEEPMFEPRINEYGYPYLYLKMRNGDGQLVPQKKMVGFFIRKGSQWLRLKSNEVNGNEGTYVIRVILDDKKAEGKDYLYLESDLGNQLIFGENVLKDKVMQNRLGAFRMLVEKMDAKKNYVNQWAEVYISAIAATVNTAVFFNPTYSGDLLPRLTKNAVRVGYQFFVQSSQLPTALPVIEVDKKEGETKAQAEERIRNEARAVLAKLDETRQAGVSSVGHIAASTVGQSMSPSDAAELHRFIYEMAAIVFNKEFTGYDPATNRPQTTLTQDELDIAVTTLFHTDWHKHTEIIARVDFFTSLMVNMVLLSDLSKQQDFTLVRESGAKEAVPVREVSPFVDKVLNKYFLGDIGGSSLIPTPTTTGFLYLTSYARVLREVSKDTGAVESWPFPMGIGISHASIIKSASRVAQLWGGRPIYRGAADVWEGDAWVFNLFGFPLQIFGAIENTKNYINGLENYGVVARTDESQNWFEQLAETFTGGNVQPVISLEEHQDLKRRQRLLGYAKLSLTERNRDEKSPNIYSDLAPVYGIMGDNGIKGIWIPGMKAIDENLNDLKEDMRQYTEYKQVMGDKGGAILKVSPGQYYDFTSANGVFDEKEFGVFFRLGRNGANDLLPSFFFSQKQAGPATKQWATWASLYDLTILSQYYGALGDSQMQNKILDSLHTVRLGLKNNEPGSDRLSSPLYPSAIDIRNTEENQIAEYALNPGPNAFMVNALLQSTFNRQNHERLLLRSYQKNYLSGKNLATLFDDNFAGRIKNYFDNLSPDWFNDLEDLKDSKQNVIFDAENGNLDDLVKTEEAQRTLTEARNIADALIQRMEPNGEWRGVIWQNKEQGVSSTEEMLAACSQFLNMYKVTEEKQYRDAALDVLRFLGRKMWSPSGNYFCVGTYNAKNQKDRVLVNPTYSTDVQAIALLIGPEIWDYMIDPETGKPFLGEASWGLVGAKMLETLLDSETGSLVEVEYKDKDQKITKITGFDTVNRQGRLLIGKQEAEEAGKKDFKERPQAVFVEQSSYVLLAIRNYVDYLKNVVALDTTTEHIQKAKQQGLIEDTIKKLEEKAALLEASLKKMAVRASTGGVGMPIATLSHIRLYPDWDYRTPDVSIAIAPTVLFGMAMKGHNPYQLGGKAWYNLNKIFFEMDPRNQSIDPKEFYKDFERFNRDIPTWSEDIQFQIGDEKWVTLKAGDPALFANTDKENFTKELEKLAQSLSKVKSWNDMNREQQQAAIKKWREENPNWQKMTLEQKIETGDPEPTSFDLKRTEGKNFLYYDSASNSVIYTQGVKQFEFTLIPSYDDIKKNKEKYLVQLKRIELEMFVTQEGALRFVDPKTKQPLDQSGKRIGEKSKEMPHLLFKRPLINDPDNKDKKKIDTQYPGDQMRSFLKEKFKNISAHEQNQILKRGWFVTDVEFEQPDKTKKTVSTLVIIQHGLSGAEENKELKKADDQSLQVIADLYAIQTLSGVIETTQEGVLRDIHKGEAEVKKILNWLRTDPEKMMAAYTKQFANFEYEKEDGTKVWVTLVFGQKMGEAYLKELNNRMKDLNRFNEERTKADISVKQGPTPAYYHPERMNRYTILEKNKKTGEVTLEVENVFTGNKITEIQQNNKVIRQIDPRKKLKIEYHPEYGSKYPLYIQSTDPNVKAGKELNVPVGLTRGGHLKHGNLDNILKTFTVWVKNKDDKNKMNREKFQFSTFKGVTEKEEGRVAEFEMKEADLVKITYDWETNEATKDFLDDDNNLLLRLKGKFEKVKGGEKIEFEERHEIQYQDLPLGGSIEKVVSGSTVYVDINPKTGELKKDPADPKKVILPTFKMGTELVTDRDQLFKQMGNKLNWQERIKSDDQWGEWALQNAWNNWEVNRHNGWNAIEFSSNIGAKKLSLLDAEDVAQEYSREKTTLFKYDPLLQLSIPVIELDRTARTGLEVVVKETTKERKFTNALVIFISTEKDSNGNILSKGINNAGKLVIYQRDHLGHLLSFKESVNSLSADAMNYLKAGDLASITEKELIDLEKEVFETTYYVKDYKEIPLETSVKGKKVLEYDYTDNPENKTVSVTAYDFRTYTVETKVQNVDKDRLEKVLTGIYKMSEGERAILYDSRIDVEYDQNGIESQRVTYIRVNPTDGSGGEKFESSTATFTEEGAVTLKVTDHLTQKKFIRELDKSKNLIKESDDYEALFYHYDFKNSPIPHFKEQGISLPHYKVDLTGTRGVTGFVKGVGMVNHLLSTYEVVATEGGLQFEIKEISAVTTEKVSDVQVRDRSMRLLHIRHPDFTTSYFDGSLAEELLYKVNQSGQGGLSIKVIEENGVKRLPTFKYDAEKNILVVNGEVQYGEETSNAIEIGNVTSVFIHEKKPADPGTHLYEYTLQGELAGKRLEEVKRNPTGLILFQSKNQYASLPDPSGHFPRVQTLTTTKEYTNLKTPFEATKTVTTTDAKEVIKVVKQNPKVSRSDIVKEWTQEKTETTNKKGETEKSTIQKLADNVVGTSTNLSFDPTIAFSDPSQEEHATQGNVVHNLLGDRAFRLHNLGYNEVVGHRLATKYVIAPLLNKFFPLKSGFAWFRVNLGLTYSYSIPLKPAQNITAYNLSAYDKLTFWVKGKSGGEKFAVTFTDSTGKGSMNVATYTDPIKIAENEWKEFEIKFDDIRNQVDLSKLIQLGIQYGNDLGNTAGSEILVSNFIFKKENQKLQLPLMAISGESSGAGDVPKVDPDKTNNNTVWDFFADETLPPSLSGHQGRFSYLKDKDGAILGTSDFLPFNNDDGTLHFRGWRFTKTSKNNGEHIDYNEVVRVDGSAYRIGGQKELSDNKFLSQWKERTYFNILKIPLFSVYENANPQLGRKPGQLRRLFQGIREYDSEKKMMRLRLWEKDMAPKKPGFFRWLLSFVVKQENVRVYDFWADGTSKEYSSASYDPPSSWEDYEASLAPELKELQENWETYKRSWEQVITPEEVEPPYGFWGYRSAILEAIYALIMFLIMKLRKIGKRIERREYWLSSKQKKEPYQYGGDSARAPIELEKETLIKEMKEWVEEIGLAEVIDDMQLFLDLDAYPYFRDQGFIENDTKYVLFDDVNGDDGKAPITLKRYVQRGAIMRFFGHWGSSQLAEYAADQAKDLNRAKFQAFRYVAYKMLQAQVVRPKVQRGKDPGGLRRWNVLFYEDTSALARYFREGKIDPASVEMSVKKILELEKSLKEEIKQGIVDAFQASFKEAERPFLEWLKSPEITLDELKDFAESYDKAKQSLDGVLKEATELFNKKVFLSEEEKQVRLKKQERIIAAFTSVDKKMILDIEKLKKLEAKVIDPIINRQVRTIQEELAKADVAEGLQSREIVVRGSLQRALYFISSRIPPVSWAVYLVSFFYDLWQTLIPAGKKLGFISVISGLVVFFFILCFYSFSLILSFVAAVLTAILTHLMIQFTLSASKKGVTADWGLFFWVISLSVWTAWNFGKALPVWYAGVIPYKELFLNPELAAKLSGGLLFGSSILMALFFLVLSYFAITWAIGGPLSIAIMEKNQQARIKATTPPKLTKISLVFLTLFVLVLSVSYTFTTITLEQELKGQGFWFFLLETLGWTAVGFGLVLFAVFMVNWLRRAGTLGKMHTMLKGEFEAKEADSLELKEWKKRRGKRVEWEYQELIEDLYKSYKLTKEEYEDLASKDDKKIADRIVKLKIKEATDRLKFWANAHLRKDKLSDVPEWNALKSLTLVIPSIDMFRHSWAALNKMEDRIDKGDSRFSGETRFYKLLQGGYRAEFEIFLNRAETDKWAWATPEQIKFLRDYLKNIDRMKAVRLPAFTDPKAKELTRKLEDWANDRLQMLETTYTGFLRVKKGYEEAARREILRRNGRLQLDMTPAEVIIELEKLKQEKQKQYEEFDYEKKAGHLVREKFQILWSVGGATLHSFGKLPIDKKATAKDGKNYDLILEMWNVLKQSLAVYPELIKQAREAWQANGILSLDEKAGSIFDKEIQAEDIELRLKKIWNDVILAPLSPEEKKKLKDDMMACQLGHVLVHDINIAFVAAGGDFHSGPPLAGSPKAKALAVAMPYVRGETCMFFDGDTEVRLEDARKLLQVLDRFNDDPKLGVLQFRQYIFNEAYNRETQVASEAVNSFWGALLRLKSRVGSVGFYGHNGIFRTEALRQAEAIQPSHISEDLLAWLAMRVAGWNGGYEDRLQFGEGEETKLAMYVNPTGKWAQGSTKAELQASRIFKLYLKAPEIPFAEKVDTLFNLAFYGIVHYFAVTAIFSFVLGAFIIGANPFTVLPPQYIFIGWMMSQAIGTFSLAQYIERYGYLEGALQWLSFLLKRGGFFYWTTLIASQSEGLKKGLKEKGAWFTAAKDQGTESYGWNYLFGIMGFGALVALPLLSIAPLFAPLDPWLFLIPGTLLVLLLVWQGTGRKFSIDNILLAGWVIPVFLSLYFFNTGGGVLLTSLFYLYVLVSFVVSPFVFNTNPGRTRIPIYKALADLENESDPFSKVGLALSYHPQKNKVDRILELIQHPDFKKNKDNQQLMIDWLNQTLSKEEKEKENDLSQIAKYLIKLQILLEGYFANRLKETLKVRDLYPKKYQDREQKGETILLREKASDHFFGNLFEADPKPPVKELSPQVKKIRRLAGIFSITILIVMMVLTAGEARGWLLLTSSLSSFWYRLLWLGPIFTLAWLGGVKGVSVFVIELFLLPVTILAWLAAILSHYLKKENAAQTLAHAIIFVVQRSRVAYRERMNAFLLDWQEEVVRNQDQEYLNSLDRPNYPPQGGESSAPTKPSTPPAPSSKGASPKVEAPPQDLEKVQPAAAPASTPQSKAVLAREEQEAVVKGFLSILAKPDDEVSSKSNVKPFALRRGIQLEEKIQQAKLEKSVQLVVDPAGNLVIQQAQGKKAPEWVKMFEAAIPVLVERLKQDETLSSYWLELLSRNDNRAPPIVLNVTPKLDGKTSSIRQPYLIDGKLVQVDILFSEQFIQTLLPLYPQNQEVVSWILAERLFHELGHTNAEKSPQEIFDEEVLLIEKDVRLNQLIRQPLANGNLQEKISSFISEHQLGPLFPGYYFNFLKELPLNLTSQQQQKQIENFARVSLHVGEILEAASKEPVLSEEKIDETEVAQTLLKKLLLAAQANNPDAVSALNQLTLPVEAGQTKQDVLQQLLANTTKQTMSVDLVASLVQREPSLSVEQYQQILVASNQSMTKQETVFLAALQEQHQKQRDRQDNILSRIETLLVANAMKPAPELVIFDSSLLKTLKSDPQVMALLKKYHSTVAIVVMKENENDPIILDLKKEKVIVSYEQEAQVQGLSLETATFNKVKAQYPQIAYAKTLVMTLEQSSSKWSWQPIYTYHVFVNKGNASWLQWHPAALKEALQKLGVSWDEFIRSQVPPPTGEEVDIHGHVLLISA